MKSIKNIQVHDRINNCIDILENDYISDAFCDICPIRIKRYFNINQLNYIMDDFIKNLPYKIRGLYFVPLKTSYSKMLYLLKDNDYKKYNSNNKSLISFRVISTVISDIYELYIYNDNKTQLQKHSYASIPNIDTSKWLNELIAKKDKCIVECKYNRSFKKWVPIKEGRTIDTITDIII